MALPRLRQGTKSKEFPPDISVLHGSKVQCLLEHCVQFNIYVYIEDLYLSKFVLLLQLHSSWEFFYIWHMDLEDST